MLFTKVLSGLRVRSRELTGLARIFGLLIAVLAASARIFAAQPGSGDAIPDSAKPQIIIFDIVTSSYDPSKSRLLTDVFRSELFKTKLFRIVEKGVVLEAGRADNAPDINKADDSQLLKIGRTAKGDKLLISSVEKIATTIAISVRIVDVATSLLDYTDNVFLANEALIFDALKEAASKIEFYYTADKKDANKGPAVDLSERWKLLSADAGQAAYLSFSHVDPEEYLTIRQYDITFTPKQYVSILQAHIDPAIVKGFLQAGISYSQTERALALGITKLDRYKEIFQKSGYGFEDYLEAYSKGIMTIKDYANYRKGYNLNYFDFGLGGVADSFPILTASTKLLLGKAGWERFWTPYQRGFWKVSTDAGIYLLTIFPAPYLETNVYIGAYPYYLKLGVGGFAEVLEGGHVGINLIAGFEMLEFLDFSVFIVPFGTQPAVSYNDLQIKIGEPGYVPIKFPYAGFAITYKMPANF